MSIYTTQTVPPLWLRRIELEHPHLYSNEHFYKAFKTPMDTKFTNKQERVVLPPIESSACNIFGEAQDRPHLVVMSILMAALVLQKSEHWSDGIIHIFYSAVFNYTFMTSDSLKQGNPNKALVKCWLI